MSNRRVYWYSGEGINLAYKMYNTSEVKLLIQLSNSFSQLNIDEKVGLRIVWHFYYSLWSNLIGKFCINNYCKLIQCTKQKLGLKKKMKIAIQNYNNVKNIRTSILYNVNLLTNKNFLFCNNILSSYYLNWDFDIHFIRVSRRYNKRYISRVRVISRPPFWVGNLLSCLLVGMFWGASLQRIDWIFIQPIIIDVNIILIMIYSCIIYKFININLNRRIRSERCYKSILVGKKFGVTKYYINKVKWFN